MKVKIPDSKEDSIYEAALNEFYKNGYEIGSTNSIVKEAGISKGALFKYFESKANLYIYVVDRAIDTLDKNIFNNIDDLSNDMFDRIVELTKVKAEISMKYTRESTVLVECIKIEDKNIKKYINDKIQYYYGIMQKIFTDGIDYSKFKEGTDINKVYETLMFISQGLQDKYMRKYKGSFELMVNDIDWVYNDTLSYINVIRDAVYK